MNKKAIILLSGGLDSITCVAIAQSQGYAVHALSFDYGQKHNVELECAKKIAKTMNVSEHRIAKIDLGSLFGGSALTDDNFNVPEPKNVDEIGKTGVPITYVPARNTIFLSYALAYAEVINACDIFIGVNALDYSGYPDCRPEYIRSFETMANLATKIGIEGGRINIQSPLEKLTKAEIIKLGTKLGVDYSLTSTCYNADSHGTACGKCDACLLRLEGFKQAGLQDPIQYQPKV